MRAKIGVLNPGQMGVYVAAMLLDAGNEVFWCSEGRSDRTQKRAAENKLIDLISLGEFCKECDIIFSICPPDKAKETSKIVIENSFTGIYVDANAINPSHSMEIALSCEKNGIAYVDGGIIGNPAWEKGATSLYLSGNLALDIASCFSKSNLEVHCLGNKIGKASAMKMCYAAYTKGTTALLCNILALANANDVLVPLQYEWTRDGDRLFDNAKKRAERVTAKAWRFSGEMKEIATTFAEASLPDGFHQAAAEIYKRLANFKDAQNLPELNEVLNSLLNKKKCK